LINVNLPCTCPLPPGAAARHLHEVSNTHFLSAVLGYEPRVHYSNDQGVRAVMQTVPTMELNGTGSIAPNLTLQALHQASLTHANFELRPEVAWYYVIHQYGEHLRHTSQVNGLSLDELAADPIVLSNANHIDHIQWDYVVQELFEHLLSRANGLHAWRACQRFPFHMAADIAPIAALVGGPNPHRPYQPTTPASHIANIGLGGTWHDWDLLYERMHQLGLGLNYGLHLGEALLQIAKNTKHRQNGDQIDGRGFWESIYQFNPRDGQDALIRGWFTAFFSHTYGPDGMVSEHGNNWQHHLRHPDKEWGWPVSEFPSHVSTVPFVLNANGGRDARHLTLVTGVTTVRRFGNTLCPELGITIIEQ
jgi:hypothetical protein